MFNNFKLFYVLERHSLRFHLIMKMQTILGTYITAISKVDLETKHIFSITREDIFL